MQGVEAKLHKFNTREKSERVIDNFYQRHEEANNQTTVLSLVHKEHMGIVYLLIFGGLRFNKIFVEIEKLAQNIAQLT